VVISSPSWAAANYSIAATGDVSGWANSGADERRDCSSVPGSPAVTGTSVAATPVIRDTAGRRADPTEVAIGLAVTLALRILLAVGIA
jgi:hypothetical protein